MSQFVKKQIRPEILAILGQLRSKIRRYVFLEGLAIVLCIIAAIFWVGLLVNWGYFQMSNLELPVWFRTLFDIGSLALITITFFSWVALRIMRHFRTRSLALILERQFPELDDRLITAVEVNESSSPHDSELTEEMRTRTIQDVSSLTQQLDISKVFTNSPMRRAVLIAVVLFFSIGGLWVTNAQAVENWFNAYIGLQEEYWPRETHLLVQIVASPGERIKEFRNHEYKHPRGGNLTLKITVPKGNNPDGKPWKLPREVFVQYHRIDENGNKTDSGSVRCTKYGDEFRHSEGNLLDSMHIWVKGHDYINRQPYKVIATAPPNVDNIKLSAEYPDYTNMTVTDETGQPMPMLVNGTQISLPMETQFVMRGEFNKTMRNVRLVFGNQELKFGQFPAGNASPSEVIPFTGTLISLDENGNAPVAQNLPAAIVRKFITANGRGFQVPFLLTSATGEDLALRRSKNLQGLGIPFLLPPDQKIGIDLEDEDDIRSITPIQITINGIVDVPPEIKSELKGIGSMITRKASIPVWGLIEDDYGLAKASFQFQVDDNTTQRIRPFRNPPDGLPKSFLLQRGKDDLVERFEVTPLEMKMGQKLTLTVYAEDGDHFNGPHSTRGERFMFTIVSEEDLLAELYKKEINLRERFEHIIKEVQATQTSLTDVKAKIGELANLKNTKPQAGKEDAHNKLLLELKNAIEIPAPQLLHAVQKNHSENRAIESSFKEILEELVNNGVHTRQMVGRLEDLIVKPLRNINRIDFPAVDGFISEYQLAVEKQRKPLVHVNTSLEEIDTMLVHMRAVLSEMEDLMTFHKAIQDLSGLIDAEKGLMEKLKEKRKQDLIDKLKGLSPEKK